jgi:hypothetical protein
MSLATAATAVPALLTGADSPPLDPGSAQAREWLLSELSKGRYHTQPSLLERITDWLASLFNGGSGTGPALPSVAVWVVLALLLVLVGVVLARVMRREAHTRPDRADAVLEEPGMTAAAYRRRAQEALAREDWDATLLDSYRAIAAASVERTILDDLPGRTADEVALELAPVFPPESGALRAAAVAFDKVRYGHLAAGEPEARDVAALEDRVARMRPVLPELSEEGMSTVGMP